MPTTVPPFACALSRPSSRRPTFYFFGAVTSILTASVQVKSTWSPTFTCFSTFLSWILRLYFQPFGPLKVIEGTWGRSPRPRSASA